MKKIVQKQNANIKYNHLDLRVGVFSKVLEKNDRLTLSLEIIVPF